MKKSEIETVKQKILDMLPCYQADIWKSGKIPEIKNHKVCSKMIRLLEDDGVIKREKVFDTQRKITTYKIEKLNGSSKDGINNNSGNLQSKENNSDNSDNSSKKNRYSVLLGKDEKFSPCCGCKEDPCDATSCTKLIEWI